jgi:hypothetical protein
LSARDRVDAGEDREAPQHRDAREEDGKYPGLAPRHERGGQKLVAIVLSVITILVANIVQLAPRL